MFFLLIDFGASHTKTAIANIETDEIYHILSHPSLKNCATEKGHYEISLEALHQQFLNILDQYLIKEQLLVDGIVLCSQMHGFALLDHEQKPMTQYITWQDERSLEPINGFDTFSLVTKTFG